MTETRLLLGAPGAPIGLIDALRETLDSSGAAVLARLGFAYVSDFGLTAMLSALTGVEAWQGAKKTWIVGLNRGITEPRALARIRSLQNCQLRLFAGGESLSLSSLAMGELFHAKVIALSTAGRAKSKRMSVLASSANLTGAAIGTAARNYEAGVHVVGKALDASQRRKFEQWWQAASARSIPATDSALDRYSQLRSKFLERNPDTLAGIDPPAPSELSVASVLWIEAGAMSGGSRNQVEFNRELAGFFGNPTRRTRVLRIRRAGREWTERPLAYKVTTFGVEIWRLSLPTEATGGLSYPGKVVRFRRGADPEGEYFELDAQFPAHRGVARWQARAHRNGYVGLTSGQRSFGFY